MSVRHPRACQHRKEEGWGSTRVERRKGGTQLLLGCKFGMAIGGGAGVGQRRPSLDGQQWINWRTRDPSSKRIENFKRHPGGELAAVLAIQRAGTALTDWDIGLGRDPKNM